MADILVVDDDRDLGDLLTDLLLSEGHSVRLARSGVEGLRMVAEHHPDLALLDVEMPQVSGPEMASLMFLQDCGQESIPVVLISAIVDLQRVAEAVGTPYFLGKPYEIESILKLVDRALLERIPPHPRSDRDDDTPLRPENGFHSPPGVPVARDPLLFYAGVPLPADAQGAAER